MSVNEDYNDISDFFRIFSRICMARRIWNVEYIRILYITTFLGDIFLKVSPSRIMVA